MGFFAWLEVTRKKPLVERRRVAVMISLGIVAVIALVWFIGFLIHLTSLFGTQSPPPPDNALRTLPVDSRIAPPY